MWPTAAFGGVTDEQFWDDLASDKPLTTTARTAQQDSAARNRPLDAVPPPDLRGADPVTDRTAIQPVYAAPQHAQTLASPVQGATRPVHAPPTASQPVSAASQPVSAASQPVSAASQPVSAVTQPNEARGRRRASAGTDGDAKEDPLTSAAYSLRSSGPVDGRSFRAPRGSQDLTRDQYEAAVAQETQTFSLADADAADGGYPGGVPPFRQGPARGSGGTSPYPYPGQPYSDPDPVAPGASANTPPYGGIYADGNGYGGSAAQADDPRRLRSERGHARHGGKGAGDGNRASRPTYPQDSGYQGNGYPAGGHPGNGHPAGGHPGNGYPAGGHPGNGYPGNGYRGPYDPGEDYRRLTSRRLPRAD